MISSYKDIRVDDYRYNLPEDRIAKYPLEKRDISKLLVYHKGKIKDDKFYNLPDYLESTNTLIFNNTKVIRARLIFRKASGARIEIFCLEPYLPADYEQALGANRQVEWKCLIGNLKKWKQETLALEMIIGSEKLSIYAERLEKLGDEHQVRFTWNNENISFSQILETAGNMPLPPYLKRPNEDADNHRYQTIYSENKGSVAAPTAGLHFSEDVLSRINEHGIKTDNLTLHVGAGTFIPVKSDTIEGHKMHSEHFTIKRTSIESLIGQETIAVGTTSVRTLESIYTLGQKFLNGYRPNDDVLEIDQWDPYRIEGNTSTEKALEAVLSYMDERGISDLDASTSIIIVPAYNFKIVKGLLTNFHMPASTLLLLVSALIGKDWEKVYNHALSNDYRFLSYGDSSLLLP